MREARTSGDCELGIEREVYLATNLPSTYQYKHSRMVQLARRFRKEASPELGSVPDDSYVTSYLGHAS